MESIDSVRQRALVALLDLDDAIVDYRIAVARHFDVAVADLNLLATLAGRGGRATPRELALVVRLSSGTLTSMLDRLERSGLMRRSPNPHDRRSVLIDSTEAGARAAAQLNRGLSDALAQCLRPAEQAAFGRTVTELTRCLAERTAETEPRH